MHLLSAILLAGPTLALALPLPYAYNCADAATASSLSTSDSALRTFCPSGPKHRDSAKPRWWFIKGKEEHQGHPGHGHGHRHEGGSEDALDAHDLFVSIEESAVPNNTPVPPPPQQQQHMGIPSILSSIPWIPQRYRNRVHPAHSSPSSSSPSTHQPCPSLSKISSSKQHLAALGEYKIRDFRHSTHAFVRTVRRMPDGLAIAGAVAVLVVVALLLALERVVAGPEVVKVEEGRVAAPAAAVPQVEKVEVKGEEDVVEEDKEAFLVFDDKP